MINADDFGLYGGVNKAVSQAYAEGVLTSATVMANMPGADEAAAIAKETPGIGIGVHLNLTEGGPVSEDAAVKCLVDSQGQFAYSPFSLAMLSMAAPRIRRAIAVELAAQVQWVIDKGISPTHLDSHKHIHCFPSMFAMVCRLAERFGIGAVRFAYEPKALSMMPWPLSSKEGRRKAKLIRAMAGINRRQKASMLKNDVLLGVTHIGGIDANFFKAVTLYNSAATAEIMTHPGLPDGTDGEEARSMKQRRVELEGLCDARTKEYFESAHIELVHYGNL